MVMASLMVTACSGAPGAGAPTEAPPAAAAAAARVALAAVGSPLPTAGHFTSPMPSAAAVLVGSPAPSWSPDPVASGTASPAAETIETTQPFDAETAAALQKVLDRARARIPTPGISVAIRLVDGRTWLGVSGDRQLSPARPVGTDTVFSIASITKTFVTAVVMQLVDEGRLRLDDHLSRYLPRYPRADRITIRQLLGHTSGIANYFESPRYSEAVFSRPGRRWSERQILDLVGKPYCAPGRCFHYSNTNFVLLGQVIRKVTGEDVGEVIRQQLLGPLGLERTSYQPTERTPRDAAHGHLWGGGTAFFDQTGSSRVLPTMSAATVAGAAGAMVSNADDLARWAMALYDTDRVLSEARRAEMLDFRRRDEYGLGTRTRIFNGRRAVGHGGSLRGYEDGMWYFPREGAAIVLLSNRGLYNPDRTLRELARTLWKHIDVPEPEFPRTRNTD
jgi:D-alanyl-D-alanine carboxypeptidase